MTRYNKAQIARLVGVSAQLLHYYIGKLEREKGLSIKANALGYSQGDTLVLLSALVTMFDDQGKDRKATAVAAARVQLADMVLAAN